ncbi:tRNA pseudouridine(38-40) synthase TruA [Nocardioides sp. Iso805N]|uniref:tRNA pseudouridine(38-40) synthase TruA n=1 Tax=Nocardioides sp. Iso805N TaxID=1283287 RepID=UPI000361E83D|nr:tRNA pseudouridine(38-40) synthase TruA [Nocardioides sp. Iso805N]
MRIRIDLSYDGSNFHGWAVQPGLRTVQGEVQRALAMSLRREEVWVTCAGRTDTGVHARGQVIHLDVEEAELVASAGRAQVPPVEALVRKLNGILDADVRVHAARVVPEAFDARFSALWRRYAYRVADTPAAYDPLTRNHVLHWPRPLDLEAMNLAAADLLGLNDYTSFCKAREGATSIRQVNRLGWARDARGTATMTVLADAFCHSMVRALVGCLLAIGEGRRDVTWAGEMLARAERSSDIHIASARGLTLEEVGYPSDDELAGRLLVTRARRGEHEVQGRD